MSNKLYSKLKTFIKENIGFLLSLTLILSMYFIKLPYTIEMPGGTIDLSDRVKVDGKVPNISGSFNMAYVTSSEGKIPYLLIGLINPNWEIIKNSEFTYSENESIEDANKRDVVYLEQSKNVATLAALKAAEIDYEINKTYNNVIYIDEQANTGIKIGDNIISVDDKIINDVDDIRKIVEDNKKGTKLKIKVLRDNKEVETYAKTYKSKEGKKIGIMAISTYDIKTDKKISIDSKNGESGPSGGMMMALMIYNGLTEKDLTKGKKIVGTGTIDENGNVGEIGGVKYKIMGAHKNNADVFIVPEGNYDEAKKVKEEKGYDIELVSVETLSDAIEYLEGE